MTERPFHGAWQWLPEASDGRLLITDRHMCAVFAQKGRPAPAGDPSEVDAAQLFRSMSLPFAGPQSATEEAGEWRIEMTLAVTVHPAMVGSVTRRAVRVESDEMRGELLRPDGSRAPTDVFRRRSRPGTSPLAGAWRLESDAWDGMMCMTDDQYRYIVTRRDRASIEDPRAELSDADAAGLYHAYDAQGGAFVVEGSTILRTPELARDPREQGRQTAVEFSLDADALTTRTSAGDDWLWRKLD